MAHGTVEHEEDRTLEEGVYYAATLVEVKEDTIKWNDKKTGEPKERDRLQWVFELDDMTLADPEKGFARRVYGDTDAKLSNHPANKWRAWGQAILGEEFDVGRNVETDDWLGLPCMLSIRKTPPGKNGRVYDEVDEVLPASGVRDTEPPF